MLRDLADVMDGFVETKEFLEVWDSFVDIRIINSDYSFKEICGLFFAFGAIDVIKKNNLLKEEPERTVWVKYKEGQEGWVPRAEPVKAG